MHLRRDVDELIRTMEPELHDGVFIFATLPPHMDLRTIDAVATIREAEGWTVVVAESEATRAGLSALFRAAWITLTVHSRLDAVGLTAAFSAALTRANISCNVIAGAHHDHIFVPIELAEHALEQLRGLQREGDSAS